MIKIKNINDIQLDNFDIYSEEVNKQRSIPDVRDGLKPIQRRILYSMYESKYNSNKKFIKSARVVGDVMGKTFLK